MGKAGAVGELNSLAPLCPLSALNRMVFDLPGRTYLEDSLWRLPTQGLTPLQEA
jgi:hypothetical protein